MTAAKESQAEKLAGYEVLLCVTGGIACYKAADLASKLARTGAGVDVAMTEAATRFVAPLTFQSLTRRQVFTSLWQSTANFDPQHLSLTETADLMIVAPATADIIAKMACGIADDLVSTIALSASGACEVLVAPAMNTRMWQAAATKENAGKLRKRGVHFVGPAEGRLACGEVGPGRMAEPGEILAAATELLLRKPPKKARAKP
ncbi:MAG: flavoprotein [Planctomycetota bacterium]|jgi:phosphopantothenoylcysteine decarboxylase/phosphopantothenate--cysteine ligase